MIDDKDREQLLNDPEDKIQYLVGQVNELWGRLEEVEDSAAERIRILEDKIRYLEVA